MIQDETLLELDYSAQSQSRKFLIGFFTYITLIFFFNLLSSYKIPTLRIQNELIDINTYEFQCFIENEIKSLDNNFIADSAKLVDHEIQKFLVRFYQNRNYAPIWVNNFNTNRQFTTLLNLLDSSAYFGFPFDYFKTSRLHELNDEFSNLTQNKNIRRQIIELEVNATFSAIKFMLYLKHGIIEQDTSSAYVSEIETLPAILLQAINQNNFRNEILAVQPNLVHHRNLLQSLSYFIDLDYSVKYTTPAFIDDKLLAKSLYYAEITSIPFFDSTNLKSEALYALEKQFSLPQDSILNVSTHKVLVSLLKYKYFLACININRLRKLKYSGENYLFVNIPEFKLHVIESNQEKETFNVIVGKKKTPTPILSSNIEKVIANPYWTVPRSIAFEMIDKIRNDSTYLKRNGYFVINGREEIVNDSNIDWNTNDPLGNKYWLRQKNSANNALGQVKFIFPNNYSVYLHDTPSKKLFSKKDRTFSHGCIRIEHPNKLAQYLMDTYYPKDDYNIDNIISEKERHVIDLTKIVNIHVQYITCLGDNHSDMIFYPDIYNLDYNEIKAVFPDLLLI